MLLVFIESQLTTVPYTSDPWTLVAQTSSSSANYMFAFWKYATSTDTAPGAAASFILSGHNSTYFAMNCLAYRGTSIPYPVQATSTGYLNGTSISGSFTVPGGMAYASPGMLVTAVVGENDNGAGGLASSISMAGYTNRVNVDNVPPAICLSTNDLAVSGSGTTSNVTATCNAYGFYDYASISLALAVASAPYAPTLSTPGANAYVDTSGLTFGAVFNSSDGANQNAYAVRIKTSSASSYSYYNASLGTLQSTPVWNTVSTTPGSTWTWALGSLISDGNVYSWSAASQEASYSIQGPFASDSSFTAQAGPGLTVYSPAGTATTSSPAVDWTTTPAAGDYQTYYQVIVEHGTFSTTPGSGTQDWTSGLVNSGNQTVIVGATLTNGVTYRAFVQVTQTGGQTSNWQYVTFTVTFDAPAQPWVTPTSTTDANGAPIVSVACQCADNLLTAADATMEPTIGSWVAASNCTVAQVPGIYKDGAYSLGMTASASGTMEASSAYGPSGYHVVAGTTYTALASFKAATTGRACSVWVNWYDSTGNYLSNSIGSPVTDATTGWVQPACQAVAPTGAAYAAVILVVASAAASEVHYVDAVGLFPGQMGYETLALSLGPNALWPLDGTEDLSRTGNTLTVDANGGSATAGAGTSLTTLSWREAALAISGGGLAYSTSALGYTGSFTLCAWVNHLGQPWDNTYEMVVANDGSVSYLSVWQGQMRFSCSVGGTQHTLIGSYVPDTGWHFLVARFNGSAMDLFLDGSQWTTSLSVSGTVAGFSTVATIGANSTGTGNYPLTGQIGEVACFPSALTNAQITSLYNAGASSTGVFVNEWTTGGFVGSQSVTAEFSIDGTTWVDAWGNTQYLPGGENASPATPSQLVTVTDVTPFPTVTMYYRCQVSVTSSGGLTLSSPWSVLRTATPVFDGWWISDPSVPESTITMNVLANWQGDQNEMLGVYRLLGRDRPVVLSDTVQGQDGQLKVAVFSQANLNAILALINSQSLLLLQSPFGQQWYIRTSAKPGTSRSINGATRTSVLYFSSKDQPYWELTFDYVEVTRFG